MQWHLPACQDVCREREGATAGAVRLPVASLCWRSYLQWLAWPCCTALFTILSYLSICYLYFKFKEGLVFPKAYLLFLTRLDSLIAKKSTSSSQPCTSCVTIQSSSRFSCMCPLQSLIALATGFYLPQYKADLFNNKWDLPKWHLSVFPVLVKWIYFIAPSSFPSLFRWPKHHGAISCSTVQQLGLWWVAQELQVSLHSSRDFGLPMLGGIRNHLRPW